MDKLIYVQKDTHEKISKTYINFKKSSKERLASELYIVTRLEILEELWARFTKGHENIISSVKSWSEFESSDYVTTGLYESAEDSYINCKTEILRYKPKVAPLSKSQGTGSSSGSTSNIKLPKITIPTFSGSYEEWITFRDMFVSLIHSNATLDDVQRLHYLKGYLTGEAEQLIRQLPITAANYIECWSQLEARYNNINYLSNCILKRLINQKIATKESSVQLKELIDTTTDCLHALNNIGIDVKSWDIIVIYIVSNKLDAETRKQWELKVADGNARELPKFAQFREFLENRFRALEFIEPEPKSRPSTLTGKYKVHKVLHVANVVCEFCTEDHRVYSCKDFLKEDVNKRREFVINKRLCFNCMGSNHSARFCPSKSSCRVCHGKHHSILHPNGSGDGRSYQVNTGKSVSGVVSVGSSAGMSAAPSGSVEVAPVVTCFGQVSVKKQVFLATAVVWAESQRGQRHYIRALLDQGSQASFVSEATVQYLGIKKHPVKGIISGLEGNSTTVSKYMVELKIQSRIDNNVVIKVQAYVLKSITTSLPNYKVEELDWLDQDLRLADPQYHTPNKIDVLLGADIYGQVIQEGIRKGPDGYPLAQATSLGWILSGTCKGVPASSAKVVAMHVCVEDNEMLKKFWEMEAEPKSSKKMMSEEETRCENFYEKTTRRDSEGRYVVRLPFKTERPDCVDGDSRMIAAKRLNGLLMRLNKSEELKEKYKTVIEEYLRLGFMEKVPENERKNTGAVYLPHHAVVRDDKDTTKVRVVYDASCKYKNGVSLNDTLMVGPTLQPELRHLLMRWRQHPICLAADVVKMYCQVRVSEKDTDFQRLLWKDNANAEAEDYRLLRVTFGTAAAPYLAVKSLQQTAHDEGVKYPTAAERVINDYYMDDLLTGCQSVKEGIIIYQEMNDLLKRGGFELQKWMSNSNELLQAITETTESKVEDREEFKLKTDEVVKLLGLTWNRRTDEFRYSVTQSPEPGPVTKRKVISHIARLYDPLGWVAPCVIVAKIIIQKLWISGIDWDSEVTGKVLEEWDTYREGLSALMQINIPRWLGTNIDDSVVELHGFCDASKVAYAAAVYLRRIDVAGNVHVSLVTAKTKVAPIKQVSIPRLELCGAVLVTRLLVEVSEILKVEKSHIRAWTDSTVVLAWINSHPSRWQTFVANRVSEILTTLDSNQWSHVKTSLNPVDCASRGITPTELLNNTMWFCGPDFLRCSEVKYSKPKNSETQLEEIKVHVAVTDRSIWNRYSSLTKLVRVVAYCRRFLDLKKPASERNRHEYLTSLELTQSLEICVKKCQGEHFEEELKLMREDGKWCKLKGSLKSLTPFIDDKGLLRVGGRLDKSSIGEDVKHPILLPKKSPLTDLIIADAHSKTLHGGIQLMLAYLCRKFFILGAKATVKTFVRKCVTCLRHNATTQNPLMGQLPAARTTPSRAFKTSGVDYAGPIYIRTSKGRGHHAYKGYICLFVCMVTRSVHIEAVSDLTSQGFMSAFKRFVARRGQCTDLWSDNGTNFVGASRELQTLFASEKSGLLSEIVETLANNGTTWHFIPPHSPNFGGLWEAGIKSVKFHLKRVIGDTTLTYEELSTVLVQIEACLNSRPLARLDTESEAIGALTPGHFLVGEPLITAPDHNFESANTTSLRRWQLTQKMLQNFWKRWSQEYLTKFLHRYKWAYQTPEPEIGDIVLVKEDNVPPCRWLLGRVVAKHTGKDNVTRVVSLRTKNNHTIKRLTSKLCILPLAD